MIYDITDNSTNALTVNTNGDAINAIASGTQVRIVPHWTLATAFTLGQSVVGSATFGNPPTQVLLPSQTTVGTDLLPAATYYYYTGTAAGGPGWRQLGGTITTLHNTDVLKAGAGFIVRKRGTATAASFVWNYRPIIAP